MRVDPDSSRLDLRRDFCRQTDVFGPNRSSETVASVVGELDSLLRGVCLCLSWSWLLLLVS